VITLGLLGKPFGFKGEIHFYPYNSKTESLKSGLRYIIFQKKENTFKITLESLRTKHDGFILKFKEYHSKEDVSQVTNYFLALEKEQLPSLKEDEFYLEDLMGMSVWNDSQNLQIGEIEKISFNHAEQAIIHVQSKNYPQLEVLIHPFVKKVDLKQRRCYIILPDYEE